MEPPRRQMSHRAVVVERCHSFAMRETAETLVAPFVARDFACLVSAAHDRGRTITIPLSNPGCSLLIHRDRRSETSSCRGGNECSTREIGGRGRRYNPLKKMLHATSSARLMTGMTKRAKGDFRCPACCNIGSDIGVIRRSVAAPFLFRRCRSPDGYGCSRQGERIYG